MRYPLLAVLLSLVVVSCGDEAPAPAADVCEATECGALCVDTRIDANNCGGCGLACGAGQLCVAGACALSCPSTMATCDGACFDPATSRVHCGASLDCSNPGVVCDSGEICAAGACVASCLPGQVLCDGACIDPDTDRAFCGAANSCQGASAGVACANGEACVAGVCELTCGDGLVVCADACTDPSTSVGHCGATSGCGDGAGSAGVDCGAAGRTCEGGVCVVTCPSGQIVCDDACVDPQTNDFFCGATGACGTGEQGTDCAASDLVCQSGACVLVCPSGQVACDGQCIDPQTNDLHCGATAGCGATGGSTGAVCDLDTCILGACHCPIGLVEANGECVDLTMPPMSNGVPKAVAGWFVSCGMRADNTITCWGDNAFNAATPPEPPATIYEDLCVLGRMACALRRNGTMVCWGDEGAASTPTGNFIAMDCGGYFACGLEADGDLVCATAFPDGREVPPPGKYRRLSLGGVGCALRTDSTAVCWGNNMFGQLNELGGEFAQIDAGDWHVCGVRPSGQIECWGRNDNGELNVPPGTYTYVSAGNAHSCALRVDGTIACWGVNADGQTNAPPGQFKELRAGTQHTCAVRSDGVPLCWGRNLFSETVIPPNFP